MSERARSDPAAREADALEGPDAQLQRELLRHYLSTADAKVERITNAIAAVRASPGVRDEETASRQALIAALHTLAGNAGTYGFLPISRRARELELQLIAAKHLPLSESLYSALISFRDQMASAFALARTAL